MARSSQYYGIAKVTPTPGVFILSQEIMYSFSRVIFLPILMAIAYFVDIGLFFNIGFVLAALLTLMVLFINRVSRVKLDSVITGKS